MDKKITIVGAGLAGLSAVDTLLTGGTPSSDIVLIHQGMDPWNRDEVYGFGGDTWKDQITFTKTIQALSNLQHVDQQNLQTKIQQALELIKKYTTDQPTTETDTEIQLTEQAVKALTENIWISFRRSGVVMIPNATCRPITRIDDIIFYDTPQADFVQEQWFSNLVLAGGSGGYGVAHSLGEYAASIADTQSSIATPSNLKINSNFSLCNMENVYVIGGILGQQCSMSSIIQGVVAGESILNNTQ